MWNVTIERAKGWVEYNIKRRLEWAEMVMAFFGIEPDKSKGEKPCRKAAACSMCGKNCGQRIGERHG